MKVWVDAQLSPALAQWLRSVYGLDASPLRELGLRDADDEDIFFAARHAGAVVMTKDQDFAYLVLRHGPPPQIVWLRSGNSTNARLREILGRQCAAVASLLASGERLVEVSVVTA